MVVHSKREMLRQRIYQTMAGFEDAEDCDRLCRDGLQGAEVQLHIHTLNAIVTEDAWTR